LGQDFNLVKFLMRAETALNKLSIISPKETSNSLASIQDKISLLIQRSICVQIKTTHMNYYFVTSILSS
jgi:hypothetical protein